MDAARRMTMPDHDPTGDERLRAAMAGDRASLGAVLEELLPRARNLIRYLVRGDQEVDDIAQEALIALARGLPSYRGEGKLSSWADRVVARATFAHLRGTRKEQQRRAERDLALVPDPSDGPDSYASRRQLVRLLDRLGEEQRHALVLHHVLGMTVPEVAEELGAPAETIRSRLRLGKQNLRALEADARGPMGGDA